VLVAQHLDEGGEQSGCHQTLAHHSQDPTLQVDAAQRDGIGAIGVLGPQAAEVILADRGEGVAANAAEHLAGQKMAGAATIPEAGAFRAVSGGVPGCRIGLQARLGGVPEVAVDDPEMLDFDLDMGFGGALPAHQCPRDRVLEVLAPVPDQPAIIGGISEDAVATALAAADGVLEPDAAIGARDTLGVELAGNLQRAGALDIEFEDAAHDRRLGLVDAAQAVVQLPGRVELSNDPVALGRPAQGAPLADAVLLAAMRLRREVLEIEVATFQYGNATNSAY
jgi:hypothetical protein